MYEAVTAVVVDDYKEVVDIFCESLKSRGVKVVGIGHNGKEAVELYEQKKPDVMFLDLMMPQYDGLYALRNIRKLDLDAKIVVVTADMREDTAKMLDELRPTKIIHKPFDFDEIEQVLNELKAKTKPSITSPPDNSQKALVSFVIYDVLKQISDSTLEEVGRRLYAKHTSYFSDCFDHPEYLRDVLNEVFGNGCQAIIKSINERLSEFSEQKQISKFLVVLND